MTTQVTYVAYDQYGQTCLCKTRWPRKELLEACGLKYASKMYVDDKDGNAQHVGYVIGRQWWTLYKVSGRGLK